MLEKGVEASEKRQNDKDYCGLWIPAELSVESFLHRHNLSELNGGHMNTTIQSG